MSAIEAFRSLAAAAGVEVRQVVELAKAGDLSRLFDRHGRIIYRGADPRRRLANLEARAAAPTSPIRKRRRAWEQRDGDLARLPVPDDRTPLQKLSELATLNNLPLTNSLIAAAEDHGIDALFDSSGRYIELH